MKPLSTGLALSATLALFYSLCALIQVIWPEQFMSFMNALFHGLDFRRLVTPSPFNWSSFLYALAVLAVWGFALGVFFAWIRNMLPNARDHI